MAEHTIIHRGSRIPVSSSECYHLHHECVIRCWPSDSWRPGQNGRSSWWHANADVRLRDPHTLPLLGDNHRRMLFQHLLEMNVGEEEGSRGSADVRRRVAPEDGTLKHFLPPFLSQTDAAQFIPTDACFSSLFKSPRRAPRNNNTKRLICRRGEAPTSGGRYVDHSARDPAALLHRQDSSR